jgi:hypothetical protein
MHATWGCAQSMCMVTGCAINFADCNMLPADGCEAFLNTDLNNCGMCGKACMAANAMMACSAGMCSLVGCKLGFANCDNQAANGCEVATNGDVNNCGACANKCNVPNAIPVCLNGHCTISQCNPGFANCNNMDIDGCEAAVAGDVNNCGGCNIKCAAAANATIGCSMSHCVITACLNGFKDCDGAYANGCEVNLTNDPNNCGACAKTCPNTQNVASTKCAASACVVSTCNAGFADCNGVYSDGCETNLNNNAGNCGMCGKVCGANLTCANGMCVNNVLFPQASYTPTLTFTDALSTTTMTMTWDGASYWSCSGGGPAGVRYAQYNAQGVKVNTFSPGIDFRSVFTKGGNTSPVYSRGYNSNIVQVQTMPGVFANSITLVGGTLDAQSSVVWNENGTELVAFTGGTLTHWNAGGALIGTITFVGFGTLNGENGSPQNRGIVKAGGYYLTYSAQVLSAWDGNGNRAKTTVLTGAGTGSDSYYGFSYGNGMVWVVDVAGGLWRGYNVGL